MVKGIKLKLVLDFLQKKIRRYTVKHNRTMVLFRLRYFKNVELNFKN